MSLNYLDECFVQLLSIDTVHLSNRRKVVLCGIAVELPVNIYTTLVLSDRIVVLLVVGFDFFLQTSTSQCSHLADSWMQQYFLDRNVELCLLLDDCRHAHSRQ